MKVVLLAAGIGKRLSPVTNYLPKPMIPIAGKPLLEYILADLIDSGFDDICIVVGHEENHIKKYFNGWKKNDIKIVFVTQDKYIGTAHATLCAKNFVGNDKFLLYLSDTLIPFDLQSKLQEMKTDKNDISILSSQSFINDSGSVGNIIIENNFVKEISEKSKNPKSNQAWAGLAIFSDASIFKILENLAPSKHGEYDITEAMNIALKNNKIIKNYSCKKFIDCGTAEGLVDGLKFILTNKCHPNKNNPLQNSLEPIYIGTDCLFGKNVIIGPFVSLGDNVVVGDNVKISKSIVFSHTKIPSNSIISGSILLHDTSLSVDENLL